MAVFTYTATASTGGRMQEDIPVFAFSPADPSDGWDNQWASATIHTVSQLRDIEDQVAGARGIMVAMSVPKAIQFFALKTKISSLDIFANDDPHDPHNVTHTLHFEGLIVIGRKQIPKGTFKMSAAQQVSVYAAGNSLAMFTPEGVMLGVSG